MQRLLRKVKWLRHSVKRLNPSWIILLIPVRPRAAGERGFQNIHQGLHIPEKEGQAVEMEIFVPHSEMERQNCQELADYLNNIYFG